MKVSGFTFIKNAITYDYPIVESILSVIPICDEFIVAVGQSDDGTLDLITSISNPKIKIIETIWDETLRENGAVLAAETNKAYAAISADADWAIYIQGDEVLHEKYLQVVENEMQKHFADKSIDGLLFDYLHFYGSYDYVAKASFFYAKEIRVLRRQDKVYSYKDAQGFRKEDDKKLNVIPINAVMHHYGWVKQPASMQAKQLNFNKYWHDDDWIQQHVAQANEYDFSSLTSLQKFAGTHPQVMLPRIQRMNWKFEFDISKATFSLKDRFKVLMLKWFNWNLNYQNYKIIKP
jgi:glycosyltransferase involved in cell wall biosynthesis